MRIWMAVPMLAGSLWAQQAPQPTDPRSPFFLKQEITVTATRSDLEALDSPVSASSVSAQEISLRNVRMLDQALDATPGVYPNRGKGPQDTLAGVGLRGFAGRGSGQARTLILIDGQPLNDAYTGQLNWASLPVDEVERVEVVRGPFSSLYGGSAMGGVVQILTRPVDRRRGELRAEYGSQDTFRYGARVADRWWDRLGVSLAYDRYQTGGYPSQLASTAGSAGTGGTPVTGFIPTLTTSGTASYLIGESGDNWWKQQSVRARAEYTFSSRTTATAQYIHQRSNYGYDAYNSYLRTADGRSFDSGTAAIVVNGAARRLTVTPSLFLPGDGGSRSHLVSGKLYHSLSSTSRLRFGAGYINSPLAYYSTPGSGSSLAGGAGSISDRPSRAVFGEAQWTWTPRSSHTFTAGTEMRHDSTTVAETSAPNYTRRTESPSPTYNAGGKAFNQGAYAQHQWRPAERWLIVWGGRYDYWRTYNGLNETVGTALVGRYGANATQSGSGKGAVTYRAPGDLALRMSFGNAFRNPTVYDLYRTWRSSTGVVYAANPALQPETLVAWEAGATKRFHGGYELDGAFFINWVDGLIYRSTDLAADPRGLYRPMVNAAGSRTRGLEASGRAPLRSWLFAKAAYTWTEALITRNPVLPDTVGKRVPQVPAHTGSLGLFAARGRWSASATGRYVSRVFSTDGNTDTVKGVYGAYDPFAEMEAAVSVELHRHLAFQVSADNLLDRLYYNYYPVCGRTVSAGFRIKL
jgi:iron complex outermembrane receptor protein